jgi:hypothetical protein
MLMKRVSSPARGLVKRLLLLACGVAVMGCVTVEEYDESESGGFAGSGGGTGGGATGGYTGGYTGGGTGGHTGGGTGGRTGGGTGGGTGGSTGGGTGGSTGGTAGSAGEDTGGGTGGGAAGSAGADTGGGTGGSAGGDTGGTGGFAGVAGSAGAPPYVGLSARYMVEEASPAHTVIGSQLWIYNEGPDTVPLGELTLRYYFTNEVTAELINTINWANIALSTGGPEDQVDGQMTISVSTMPSARPLADSYVEMGFTAQAPSLEPDHRVKFAWRVQNHASQNFTQTNDYSFDAGVTSETEWDKVVLLRSGTAVWGLVP